MRDFSASIDLGNLEFFHENMNDVLYRHKRDTGNFIAGFVVEFVPFEVLSAFNITPLLLPPHFFTGKLSIDWDSLPYDVLFCPKECTSILQLFPVNKTIVHSSEKPDSYGHASRADLFRILDSVVADITGKSLLDIDRSILSVVTNSYNNLRRIIRGISALRMDKPRLLSCLNLQLIFETALCLPACTVIDHLSAVLDEMNRGEHLEENPRPRAMVSGSLFTNPAVLDELEASGFHIVEDDLCIGRRNFDLSHNTDSPQLFEEILDAFSYKPLCPCLRSQKARYDLLYRLAGNYGIETVILLNDPHCGQGSSHLGELRVRLMRAGVDPLLITPENAGAEAARYLSAALL